MELSLQEKDKVRRMLVFKKISLQNSIRVSQDSIKKLEKDIANCNEELMEINPLLSKIEQNIENNQIETLNRLYKEC